LRLLARGDAKREPHEIAIGHQIGEPIEIFFAKRSQ
jgi:hypothetical protein